MVGARGDERGSEPNATCFTVALFAVSTQKSLEHSRSYIIDEDDFKAGEDKYFLIIT